MLSQRFACAALTCLAGWLPAQSYEDLLAQAEARLRAGDAAAALPLLESALAKDVGRWDGHYVKAVALLSLSRAAEAVPCAEAALSRAPAEQRPVVERLLQRARSLAGAPPAVGAAATLLQEAEAAQRDGMRASAAKKFAAAFELDPTLARAGLKAASLYFLLEEHGAASRLLARLRSCDDATVRDESAQMYEQLRRAVATELQRRVDAARSALAAGDLPRATAALDTADELWSGDAEVLVLRCKLAVRQQQLPAALQHLRQAAAAGFDRVDALRGDVDLIVLAGDPAARAWLEQAFGPKLLASLVPAAPSAPATAPVSPNPVGAPAATAAVAPPPASAAAAVTPGAPADGRSGLGQPLRTGIGLMMLPLQPTTDFQCGSPATEVGRDADEDLHPAPILQPFWLAETEVTQRQWQAVMATAPWQGQGHVQVGDDVAATFVSWHDAQEFCRRLTEQERSSGQLPAGHAYRLPREAEWEWACRAGTRTAYSFGDDPARLGEHEVFDGRSEGQFAHRVRLRRANAWGFFDLQGNVAEWCEDLYGGSHRVTRGGTWRDPAQYCRAANRMRYPPDSRYNDLGFRPVLAIAAER
jgi:tetratricopeptide (TPR) repeat protein